MQKVRGILWGASMLALAAPAAAAQVTDVSTEEPVPAQPVAEPLPPPVGTTDIIVTAQRRAENIQRVPMAITALDEVELERSGTQNLQDLVGRVPGLNVFSEAPGQNQIVIRGISSSVGVATTGFYLDDTPVSAARHALDAAMFDVQRIEVLRGPQGTLYGAGSMGGTIRYITHEPNTDRLEHAARGVASFSEGGGFNFQLNGMLNAPLARDVAALRLVAFYRNQDGYIDRFAVHPTDILGVDPSVPPRRNVNTEETFGFRARLAVDPAPNVRIMPSVFHQETRLGGAFTFDMPPGSFADPFQTRLADEPSDGHFTIYNLTATVDIGQFNLLSSTSHFDRRLRIVEDTSKFIYNVFRNSFQTRTFPVPFPYELRNDDIVQEFRVAYGGPGFVTGVAGAYLAWVKFHQFFDLQIPPGYREAFNAPFGPDALFFMSDITTRDRELALFTELNFHLTERLTLTAGVRAFDIHNERTRIGDGIFNGGPSSAVNESSDRGLNPKAVLSFQTTPDVLLYASAAKGFRRGGGVAVPQAICDQDFQDLGITNPTAFDPDSLWNYEAGVKSRLFDRRLRFNAAAYYIKWHNIQQMVTLPGCGFQYTGNFGEAVSKGVEVELAFTPTDFLSLGGQVSFNDAKLTDTVQGSQGRPGDPLEHAPRWTWSAHGELRASLVRHNDAYFRFNHAFVGSATTSFNRASPFYIRDNYHLTDARFGWQRGGWELGLFANNIFNTRAETGLPLSFAADLANSRRIAVNRPRTIGIDAGFRF
jgi:iron complex outermembrane recepter protein